MNFYKTKGEYYAVVLHRPRYKINAVNIVVDVLIGENEKLKNEQKEHNMIKDE